MSWKQSLSILLILALLLGCGVWTPVRAAAQTEIYAVEESSDVEVAAAPILPALPDEDIALNYTKKVLAEGNGFTLSITANVNTGTVTWSSDNTYVATVNSSGYVQGLHAGTATITATHTDANGMRTSASCTIYVTVADGMYYIKNASSEQCITTGGSTAALYAQETGEDSRLGQLWLIEYDESSHLYRICPIRDLSRALTVDQNNYVAVDDVQPQFCWDIVSYSLGYAIQYAGDSSDTAKPVVASMPGSQIYLGDWQASLSCHWELESAYGIFLRDSVTEQLVDSNTEIVMENGDSHTLAELGLKIEIFGRLTNSMTWSSSDNKIATVDCGTVTQCGYGWTVIQVCAKFDDQTYSASFSFFARGTTYINFSVDSEDEAYQPGHDQTVDYIFQEYAKISGQSINVDEKDEFLDMLTSANYCCISLHGNKSGAIKISPNEILTVSELAAIPESEFADIQLVILTSCYSAKSTGTSFVDVFLSKGVDVVIGFEGETECETSCFWTQRLILHLTEGMTVGEAIEEANDDLLAAYEDEEKNGYSYNMVIPLITEGLNYEDLEEVWDIVLFPQP